MLRIDIVAGTRGYAVVMRRDLDPGSICLI